MKISELILVKALNNVTIKSFSIRVFNIVKSAGRRETQCNSVGPFRASCVENLEEKARSVLNLTSVFVASLVAAIR